MAFQTPETSQASSSSIRRPYHGSCHCGKTRYITYLSLPPALITAKPPNPSSTIRLRKCNCSTCHKLSFFHVRLPSSPNDFLLLSPTNPTEGGLKDYTCFEGRIHWYFCGECGVRCFAFAGNGELRLVDVDWEGPGVPGKKKQVWAPRKEGWVEGGGKDYLSVNAATLEPGQLGLDLREWTEKGWITYLDSKDEVGEDRLGKPHEGGMY